jgi:hypothetical protein
MCIHTVIQASFTSYVHSNQVLTTVLACRVRQRLRRTTCSARCVIRTRCEIWKAGTRARVHSRSITHDQTQSHTHTIPVIATLHVSPPLLVTSASLLSYWAQNSHNSYQLHILRNGTAHLHVCLNMCWGLGRWAEPNTSITITNCHSVYRCNNDNGTLRPNSKTKFCFVLTIRISLSGRELSEKSLWRLLNTSQAQTSTTCLPHKWMSSLAIWSTECLKNASVQQFSLSIHLNTVSPPL